MSLSPMRGRLAGHALAYEGSPVLTDGCCAADRRHLERNMYDQHGHALCSCGQFGPHETTTAERRRWHRQHKTDVASSP